MSGHEATDSTTIASVLRLRRRVRRVLRRGADVVVFEISGRAIAETVACAWLLRRSRRPLVWVTAHDPPALTGGLGWFGALDRKGGRRVAAALSRGVGRRVERYVVERADVVACLSQRGRDALSSAFGRADVTVIAPVADVAEHGSHFGRVFVPGPVDVAAARCVLEAAARAPGEWIVDVGRCGPETELALRGVAARLGIVSRVAFTGVLGQQELTQRYRDAGVVVWWRTPSGHGAAEAACSYPVIDGIAAGAVVVTNAARGAQEHLEASGGFELSHAPERLRATLDDLLASPDRVDALGRRAAAYAQRALSVHAVAEQFADVLRDRIATHPRSS